MSVLINEWEKRNSQVARDDAAQTRLQPSILVAIPKVKAIVIGCADMRVDPAHVFALQPGESVVLRNIGGRVTPGLLAQLSMLGRMAEVTRQVPGGGGEFNLVVMQHTDCGLGHLAGQTAMLEEYFQIDGESVPAKTVKDPRTAVAGDVAILKKAPGLPPTWFLSGLVYDVATGLVETVVAPERIGA